MHPLVVAERENFLAALPADSSRLVVFDIPLLFETDGRDQVFDALASCCMSCTTMSPLSECPISFAGSPVHPIV